MHWYTADLHFNHENIITLCDRPFRSAAEMDAHYVSALRSTVMGDDDLWILGDFCMGKQSRDEPYLRGLFEQIPGRKHLIRGNHDKPWIERFGWASRHDLKEISDGAHRIVMCHYPLRSWNRMHRGSLHYFGHVHCERLNMSRAWNVGVDAIGGRIAIATSELTGLESL